MYVNIAVDAGISKSITKVELNIMDKTKCITFDPVAQEALPDHIKAKTESRSR